MANFVNPLFSAISGERNRNKAGGLCADGSLPANSQPATKRGKMQQLASNLANDGRKKLAFDKLALGNRQEGTLLPFANFVVQRKLFSFFLHLRIDNRRTRAYPYTKSVADLFSESFWKQQIAVYF